MEPHKAYQKALRNQRVYDAKQAESNLAYRAKQVQIDAEALRNQRVYDAKQAESNLAYRAKQVQIDAEALRNQRIRN